MEPRTVRRSDRWAAPGVSGNPWAVVSLVLALLGLVSVGVIAAATAGVRFLRSLPDQAGYALYGAVPSFGVLAFFTGLAGRRRTRRAWLAWIGLVLGSLLVVLGVAVVVILANAWRSLG